MAKSHPNSGGDVRDALEVIAMATAADFDQAVASVPARLEGIAAAVRSAVVHQHSVEALESALGSLPTAVSPATARAAQATENVWRRVENEFGLLSSTQASALLGASNANRAYAADLRKRDGLLGARRKNAYVYPGFQFDRDAAAVRSWVTPLLRLARRRDRSEAAVVMWMMAPTTYLAGDRPVDHVVDTDRLVDAAERAWGVEW